MYIVSSLSPPGLATSTDYETVRLADHVHIEPRQCHEKKLCREQSRRRCMYTKAHYYWSGRPSWDMLLPGSLRYVDGVFEGDLTGIDSSPEF